MGRQVNFFMSLTDETCFLQYLKNKWKTDFLLERSDTSTPKCFIDEESDMINRQYKIYLWNPSITTNVSMTYINKKYGFRIDQDSEVIEYIRPSLSDSDFSRSIFEISQRIYIDPFYLSYDKNRIIRKNEKFIKWYESISRWLKHRSVGTIDDVYVMPNAMEYLLTNGLHMKLKH